MVLTSFFLTVSSSNVGETMIGTVGDLLKEFTNAKDEMAKWMILAKAIGSIFSYIYIARKFVPKMMMGEEFDLTDFFKPILISALLSFYTPITSGIEYIVGANLNASVENNNLFAKDKEIGKALIDLGTIYNKIQNSDDDKKTDASSAQIDSEEKALQLAKSVNEGDTNPGDSKMLSAISNTWKLALLI